MERITVNSWAEALRFKDHTDRYELAPKYCAEGAVVLDAACGVGYGTYFLAADPRVAQVCGIDNSVEALTFAERCFASPKIVYLRKNLDDRRRLCHLQFNLIVCFETIGYLVNEIPFLENIHARLKPEGIFLVSIGRQTDADEEKEIDPYRYRHYQTREFRDLLRITGFSEVAAYTQSRQGEAFLLLEGRNDQNNIFICRRA